MILSWIRINVLTIWMMQLICEHEPSQQMQHLTDIDRDYRMSYIADPTSVYLNDDRPSLNFHRPIISIMEHSNIVL